MLEGPSGPAEVGRVARDAPARTDGASGWGEPAQAARVAGRRNRLTRLARERSSLTYDARGRVTERRPKPR